VVADGDRHLGGRTRLRAPAERGRLSAAAGGCVLVVDGANVVGSRPDGWWRDRPGAARRLHARLAAGALPHGEVVLVLEGAARAGVAEGDDAGVRTVHAAGSGDDAVVRVVEDRRGTGTQVVVVTADRGLRRRVDALGARCEGPGRLLARLDGAAGQDA
jgi:hypothetical protein